MAGKKSQGKSKARAGKNNSPQKAANTKTLTEETLAIQKDNIVAEELPAVEELVVETAPPLKNEVPESVVEAENKADTAKSAEARKSGSAVPGVSAPRLPGGITARPTYSGDPYLPRSATIFEMIDETPNIRTLRLVLDDREAMKNFKFEPGQVGQLSVYGVGEATFVINSSPSEKHYLQFSVMRAGEVTDAIHRLQAGDKIGVRAPLGNYFPYNDWKGKNIFFIGGGIGMAPIRTIMLYLLEHKEDYGKISLLYGARSPKDMAYSYELDAWKNNPDLDCTFCIDNPYEEWGHRVGLIPKVLEELNPSSENTVAVLCGPPIMIKFTLQSLLKLGFDPENIVTTLEKRMKCGIGICGRCNIGDRYVCVDGPVFTLKALNGLPPDM